MGFLGRLAKQAATRAIDLALERVFSADLVQSTHVRDRSVLKQNEPERSLLAQARSTETSPYMSESIANKNTSQQGQLDFYSEEKRWKAIAEGKLVMKPEDKPAAPAPKADTPEPEKVEQLAEVIRLMKPEHPDYALTSLPLVRNWLFAPDKTKLRYREFQVGVSYKGREVVQSLSIGDRFAGPNKGYGVLTTRHQRAMFTLQHLWQKQGGRMATANGRRFGTVCCSSWQLEESLFGTHGGRQKDMVRQIVQELSAIPVKIENYVGRDGSLNTLDVTSLIHGYFASSRKTPDGQIGFPWVEILLGPLVVQAFEANEVKPINLEVMRGFSSDTAALIYPKLDYLLARHDQTELRLDSLVSKLGLSAKRLKERNYRRSKFVDPVAELNGKPLSSGAELVVTLEPTVDGEDFKIIAKKK